MSVTLTALYTLLFWASSQNARAEPSGLVTIGNKNLDWGFLKIEDETTELLAYWHPQYLQITPYESHLDPLNLSSVSGSSFSTADNPLFELLSKDPNSNTSVNWAKCLMQLANSNLFWSSLRFEIGLRNERRPFFVLKDRHQQFARRWKEASSLNAWHLGTSHMKMLWLDTRAQYSLLYSERKKCFTCKVLFSLISSSVSEVVVPQHLILEHLSVHRMQLCEHWFSYFHLCDSDMRIHRHNETANKHYLPKYYIQRYRLQD